VSDIIVAPDDGVREDVLIDDGSVRDIVRAIVAIGERVIGVVAIDRILPDTQGQS
jgi:hypothetical protein